MARHYIAYQNKEYRVPQHIVKYIYKILFYYKQMPKSFIKEMQIQFKNEGSGIKIFQKMFKGEKFSFASLKRIQTILNTHKDYDNVYSFWIYHLHGGDLMYKWLNQVLSTEHKNLLKHRVRVRVYGGVGQRGYGLFTKMALRNTKLIAPTIII